MVIDDQSGAGGNLTAAQTLVSQDNVFAVIENSSFAYGGARYLQSKGVPVAGDEFDGPEWGEQPYTNMFSWSGVGLTPFDGSYYTYTSLAQFLKSVHVTKLASLAYGISPSAQAAAQALISAAATEGIADCYKDFSVAFGAVDFTTPVLAIKSKGCDAVQAPFVEASDISLSTAVKQGGVNAVQLYYTGYGTTTLATEAARTGFNGAYASSELNFTTPNGPTQQMVANLQKYSTAFKGDTIPIFGEYSAYLSADLMATGLQGAGTNPTRQSFITNLRKVTNYTAGGILPSPTTFANFGTKAELPATSCEYVFQLQGNNFVATNGGKAWCGELGCLQELIRTLGARRSDDAPRRPFSVSLGSPIVS